MNGARWLPTAILTLVSLPLMGIALSAQAAAQGSATNMQMQPVSGELVSKLDSKSARIGEPVALKTTQKITIGATVIPKGSQLLGHVTAVQAHNKTHQSASIAIAFDQAAPRNGQSFAIRSQIDSVAEPQSRITEDENASGAFNQPRDAPTATAESQLAGNSLAHDAVLNADLNGGQMQTRIGSEIPGVTLTGDATGSASGELSAARKNFRLDPGTQMVVGVVAAGK
jgi:hypothetical protein